MAVGFKKSLFGFNCGDVMQYIERSQKSFAEKEKELSKQVEELSRDLDLSNENYRKLNDEKELISKKLSDFSEKYEEIERLSENIGKLYLVAQANAQAIMANSEKNADLANKEVEKNLNSIDSTHESLGELKAEIMQTSADFVAKIDTLVSSLNTAREQISIKNTENHELAEQFENMFAEITK